MADQDDKGKKDDDKRPGGDVDPDDNDTGDDGDGDPDDDWTPPSREDWERTQEALKKARRDARAAKRDKTTATDKTGDGDKTADVQKAVADATAAADGKWKPVVVRAAARSAFVEAGLVLPKKNPDAALARAIKLLDVDDLEIGDDGQVDGLREQVEEIRADFPELFATTRQRTGRVDGADKPGQGNGKPQSSAEAIAALLS